MTTRQDPLDAIVIGAGVGGLCVAARLAHLNKRVLMLEAMGRVGGRFSTRDVNGYKLPTGAVAIELGGVFLETYRLLGLDPELRRPEPPLVIRIGGRDLRPGTTVWNYLIKRATKAAGAVAEKLRGGAESEDDEMSLEEWVHRYTNNDAVLGLFQALSASIFTVNIDELPANVFLRLLRVTGGYKDFGFAPQGNRAMAELLVDAIKDRGGTVLLEHEVESILVEGGKAIGVQMKERTGRERAIYSRVVVSNAGPRATAGMVSTYPEVEPLFRERIRRVEPTSILALAFSTQKEVVPHPGIWTFTGTRRLCNLANLTATCPELAPAGRTLYEAYSVPRPSVGGAFDPDEEKSLLLADLNENVSSFSEAEMVDLKIMSGDEPGQHCRPGFDPDPITPLQGLFEVGDGVKPYGWVGTTASAETARVIEREVIDYLDRTTSIEGREIV